MAMKGFVLKSKFISPVVPYEYIYSRLNSNTIVVIINNNLGHRDRTG